MSISKQTTIWCDTVGCDAWTAIDVSVVATARQMARGEGWRYFGGEDHCPNHRGARA